MKTPCNAKRITGSFHSCGYMFYSSLSKLSETSKFLLVIIVFCVCFHKNWSKSVDVAFHFFFQILINRYYVYERRILGRSATDKNVSFPIRGKWQVDLVDGRSIVMPTSTFPC